MNAVLYKPNGAIYAVLRGGTEAALLADAKSMGYPSIITSEKIEIDTHYVADGEIVEIPEKPSNSNKFDYESGQWSLDLDKEKAIRWKAIKQDREGQEFGAFTWNNHTFQCDQASQMRIQSAVQAAILDDSLSMVWTLADNTTQTFNATELKQIGKALSDHVKECHDRGRILRAQIDAATTQEELEAIVW